MRGTSVSYTHLWDGFYQWLSDNGLCEMPIEAGTGFSNDYLA